VQRLPQQEISKGEGSTCGEPTKGAAGGVKKEFRKCSKTKSIQVLWGGNTQKSRSV